MTVSHITDHADRAYARLPMQDKTERGLVALQALVMKQVQHLEDVVWDLFTKRGLDVAEGEQLNVIGRYLKEPRPGAAPDDDTYRLILKARAAALRSSGTAPQLLHIFKLLLPNNTLVFQALGNAGFVLDIGEIDPDLIPEVYARFIEDAEAAGINGQGLYSDFDAAHMFTLSDVDEGAVSSTDMGLGDENDPDVGGHLAGVFV